MTNSKITPRKDISRRNFLRSSSAALALAVLPGMGNLLKVNKKRNKMILSFYMDDTNPEFVKAEAFRDFLDYCKANGIKGESSVILGYSGKSIVTDTDDNHRLYIKQVQQAHSVGIDSNMEIMTHHALYDFKAGKMKETGIHEGLWLHEPEITIQEYQSYFESIVTEAAKAGIKYTGFTWPGCGCEACTKRYAELKSTGPLHITQPAFEALLNVAKQGKFRGRVLPLFYESSETEYGIFRRASEGRYGVYDLMPNAQDHFGIWENSREHVDPDYYITEDGKSGILLRHLENNAPYCMWYMHWQGVNPQKGVGWEAFKTVTGRIKKHLKNQVEWMRPSDIATSYHDSNGWSFTDSL